MARAKRQQQKPAEVTPLIEQARAHADDYVYFMGFVDPPVLSDTLDGPLITRPWGWQSRAVDRLVGLTFAADPVRPGSRPTDGQVVASTWDDRGGPVVLGRIRLRDVIRIDEFFIKPRFTSLCAAIEYYLRGRQTCDRVLCTGLVKVPDGGGCNPGGLVVFPHAPTFSAVAYGWRKRHMFRNFRTHYARFKDRPRLHPDRFEQLFGRVWGSRVRRANVVLERLTELGDLHLADGRHSPAVYLLPAGSTLGRWYDPDKARRGRLRFMLVERFELNRYAGIPSPVLAGEVPPECATDWHKVARYCTYGPASTGGITHYTQADVRQTLRIQDEFARICGNKGARDVAELIVGLVRAAANDGRGPVTVSVASGDQLIIERG
jgi:hypothetical protein